VETHQEVVGSLDKSLYKENRMRKVKIKINVYSVLSRAVEEGIGYGWMRAHKHSDNPSEETIKSELNHAIMNAICEVIKTD
jgi:hypothetical protein